MPVPAFAPSLVQPQVCASLAGLDQGLVAQLRRSIGTLLVALFALLMPRAVQAQEPWLSFDRTYEERAFMQAVRPLGDSGYVAVGRVLDTAAVSYAVVWRLDTLGQLRWTRSLAAKGSARFEDVLILPDGMVAVGSTSQADGSAQQPWQARFNLDGDTLWTAAFAFGQSGSFDAIAASSSGWWTAGRVALSGELPQVLLSAFAMDGSEDWTALYGSASLELAFDLARHANGDPALVGRFFDGTRDRVYAVRADPSGGAERWTRSYSNGTADLGLGIAVQPDGGAVFCGSSRVDGNEHGVLIGVDADGDFRWQSRYGGPLDDRLHAIQRLASGDLLSAGRYKGDTAFQPWSLRTDSLGALRWAVRDSTRSGSWEDLAFAPDGALVLVGHADGAARLARRGPNGVSCPPVGEVMGSVGGSWLDLSWPGVEGATAYEVRWSRPGWSSDSIRWTSSPSLVLNTLLPETAHSFKVRAFCGPDVYGLSAEAQFAVDQPNGLSGPAAETAWTLFPNPVVEQARILLEGPGNAHMTWRLLGPSGQVLDQGRWNTPIGMATLPAGLYRVELLEQGRLFSVQNLVKATPSAP